MSSGRAGWPAAAADACEQSEHQLRADQRPVAPMLKTPAVITHMNQCSALSHRLHYGMKVMCIVRSVDLWFDMVARTHTGVLTAHLRWCSRKRLRNSWTTVPSIVGTAERSNTTVCRPPSCSACTGPGEKGQRDHVCPRVSTCVTEHIPRSNANIMYPGPLHMFSWMPISLLQKIVCKR